MYKICDATLKLVVYFLIFEIVLGGAGRIISIGPLSIRMILYIVAFLLTAVCLVSSGYKNYYKNFEDMGFFYKITALFMLCVAFAATKGIIAHHSLHEIIGDVTGYISFLLIIVFNLVINGKDEIKRMSVALCLAAVIQAIVIVIIHYGIGVGIFTMPGVDNELQYFNIGGLAPIVPDTIRIFFKSSMYLQIAFIILVGMSSRDEFARYKKAIYISLVFITYAIILTFTRGFWFGVVVALIIYIVLKQVQNLKKVIVVILLGTTLFLGLSYVTYKNNNVFLSIVTRTGLVSINKIGKNIKINETLGEGTDDTSADYRKKLAPELFKDIFKHPILGSGFGVVLTEIGQKVSRSEYMYLDIWMEMGLVGLVVFIAIFIIMISKWIKIRKYFGGNSRDMYILDALMVSLIGMLITTGINPFFNNPLGITYVVFVILAVNAFGKENY